MADPAEVLLAERARALRRVAALEREFAELAAAASAGGTDDEHDPEGATLAFERQHAAALLEQARDQQAAIEAALVRVREGRYGLCDRCGQPIGDDRLAARPAALTCIRCAALPGSYSARSANAVRVRAAQPAGMSARGPVRADAPGARGARPDRPGAEQRRAGRGADAERGDGEDPRGPGS
jgi:DnaK suppressor protein